MQKQPEQPQPQITRASGRVRLNVEPLEAIFDELQPLLEMNWAEAAVEKDISPHDPDWAKYYALEAAGILGIVTLRVNGKLGGYVACLVGPTMQSKSTVWGQIDTIWLHPKLRRGRLGDRLLQFAEDQLKAAGAKIVKIDTAPRVSNWLVRKGYTARHVVLTKVLGE
jgi:ribosomal protein S18 acetylase RimI-like enzyme